MIVAINVFEFITFHAYDAHLPETSCFCSSLELLMHSIFVFLDHNVNWICTPRDSLHLGLICTFTHLYLWITEGHVFPLQRTFRCGLTAFMSDTEVVTLRILDCRS